MKRKPVKWNYGIGPNGRLFAYTLPQSIKDYDTMSIYTYAREVMAHEKPKNGSKKNPKHYFGIIA